jgi:hypothetical protein
VVSERRIANTAGFYSITMGRLRGDAMKDDEREKVWLYGQLLIDFANAETSDEAGLTYIANIKKSFGFSDKEKQFIEDRDIPHEFEGFPTLSSIKSKFNEDENQLKKPKIQLKKIKVPIIITQSKIPAKKVSVVGDSVSIDQMVIEEHKHIDSLKSDLYACLKEINDVRGPVKRSDNDEDFYKARRLPLLSKPKGVVKDLNHGTRAMFYFVDKYHQIPAPLTYVAPGDHGRLTARNRPIFNADYFLNRYDRYASDFLTQYYDKPISYCLIEFLRNNEAVHRLNICPYCKKFFMARDKKRVKCYDPKCRKVYEREKKKKQRSEDPVRYV